MKKRPDTDYRSENLDNGLTVWEELLNAPSRGYSITDLVSRTGINYDQCRRALFTLKLRGYARQFIGAWKPGDRCRVFAARVDLAVGREQTDVMALAESGLRKLKPKTRVLDIPLLKTKDLTK